MTKLYSTSEILANFDASASNCNSVFGREAKIGLWLAVAFVLGGLMALDAPVVAVAFFSVAVYFGQLHHRSRAVMETTTQLQSLAHLIASVGRRREGE